MEETAFDRESDLQELLTAHPQLLDFLDCFDLDIQALVRRLLDTARRHGATFFGRPMATQYLGRLSSLAQSHNCRMAYSTRRRGRPSAECQPLRLRNLQLNGIEELPEALSERLRRWASLFHSRGTFVPVADPWNNTNPKDYGLSVFCRRTCRRRPRHRLPHAGTCIRFGRHREDRVTPTGAASEGPERHVTFRGFSKSIRGLSVFDEFSHVKRALVQRSQEPPPCFDSQGLTRQATRRSPRRSGARDS